MTSFPSNSLLHGNNKGQLQSKKNHYNKIVIHVPASTANIGPGFDVLGIGLSLYLTIEITSISTEHGDHDGDKKNSNGQLSKFPETATHEHGEIVIHCEGYGSDHVSKDPKENLITSTAMFVAECFDQYLPSCEIKCLNNIPLGSGLGSSGTAVVAGVCLANELCGLEMSRDRLLDFCLHIEGHPDNVAPSLLGGFVAAYMREDNHLDISDKLEANHDDGSISKKVTIPHGIGRYMKLKISKDIKAVVVTPKFQVATKLARQVLPENYSRKDVVFNLQRLAVLTHALAEVNCESRLEKSNNSLKLSEGLPNGSANTDSENITLGMTNNMDYQMIYEAMKDVIHQPYRKHLIPGLSMIFAELEPAKFKGLLGVCISGAGPTVLSLAVDSFQLIGEAMQKCFKHSKLDDDNGVPSPSTGIESELRVLDIDRQGVRIEYY